MVRHLKYCLDYLFHQFGCLSPTFCKFWLQINVTFWQEFHKLIKFLILRLPWRRPVNIDRNDSVEPQKRRWKQCKYNILNFEVSNFTSCKDTFKLYKSEGKTTKIINFWIRKDNFYLVALNTLTNICNRSVYLLKYIGIYQSIIYKD